MQAQNGNGSVEAHAGRVRGAEPPSEGSVVRPSTPPGPVAGPASAPSRQEDPSPPSPTRGQADYLETPAAAGISIPLTQAQSEQALKDKALSVARKRGLQLPLDDQDFRDRAMVRYGADGGTIIQVPLR